VKYYVYIMAFPSRNLREDPTRATRFIRLRFRDSNLSVSPVVRESTVGEEDVRITRRTSIHEHQEIPVIFQDASSANDGHSSSQQLEIETLLAVNHLTRGTEFYGQSSNFV
jgi:hypothetical protein